MVTPIDNENTYPLNIYSRFAVIVWRWSNARYFVTINECDDTDTFKSIQNEWRKHGRTVVDITFVEKES